MEKKKRRYEISSKVHIPDMDDIQKAASNFNEAHTSDGPKNDFIERNAKHVVSANEEKYNPMLNSMKKEMLQLAIAVASEESENRETQEETELNEQEEMLAAAADEQKNEQKDELQNEFDENSAYTDVSQGAEILI